MCAALEKKKLSSCHYFQSIHYSFHLKKLMQEKILIKICVATAPKDIE